MTGKECALPCAFENCDGCVWRMTDAEAADVLERWNKCQHIDKVCTVDCGECEYDTTAEQVDAALARAVERLRGDDGDD